MKMADLSRDQVDKLPAEVTPMLGYRSRQSDRMDKRGLGTEPLADSARKVRNAMQELRMALHYLHCDGLGERANRATSADATMPDDKPKPPSGPSVMWRWPNHRWLGDGRNDAPLSRLLLHFAAKGNRSKADCTHPEQDDR
jgi:hypothetical protein